MLLHRRLSTTRHASSPNPTKNQPTDSPRLVNFVAFGSIATSLHLRCRWGGVGWIYLVDTNIHPWRHRRWRSCWLGYTVELLEDPITMEANADWVGMGNDSDPPQQRKRSLRSSHTIINDLLGICVWWFFTLPWAWRKCWTAPTTICLQAVRPSQAR